MALDLLKPALTTFSTTLSAYTKQAGVVYDLTSQISAYTSYSQSIKPQTNIAFDVNGNSGFPPETGLQYEAGVKFETPSKNLNLSLAAYEITRTNVVVPSGTNFTVATGAAQVGQAISRLDGEQQSKGFEAELQWQPLKHWQIQTGFAYSKATITASTKNPESIGFDLANAPRLTGNIWTRYNFPTGGLKGLGVGTGIVYVGKAWAGRPDHRALLPPQGLDARRLVRLLQVEALRLRDERPEPDGQALHFLGPERPDAEHRRAAQGDLLGRHEVLSDHSRLIFTAADFRRPFFSATSMVMS